MGGAADRVGLRLKYVRAYAYDAGTAYAAFPHRPLRCEMHTSGLSSCQLLRPRMTRGIAEADATRLVFWLETADTRELCAVEKGAGTRTDCALCAAVSASNPPLHGHRTQVSVNVGLRVPGV
jgi:hypothetical protein